MSDSILESHTLADAIAITNGHPNGNRVSYPHAEGG
jgi:hypothetical protein